MMRLAKTRFPFNGLPKGLVFGYDEEVDVHIVTLIQAGYIADVTPDPEPEPNPPPTQSIFPVGIESQEEMGEIGGEGEDQSPGGGRDGDQAVPAAGERDVQGDQGAGPKVAKGRQSRSDVRSDG